MRNFLQKNLGYKYFWWGRGSAEIGFNSDYYLYIRDFYVSSFLTLIVSFLLISLGITALITASWGLNLWFLVILPIVILFETLSIFLLLWLRYGRRRGFPIGQYFTNILVKFSVDYGNIIGFKQGLKNRPYLLKKKFKNQLGNAYILFTPYSVHDKRFDSSLLKQIRELCKKMPG
jgi:hypothetical protein